MKRRSLLLPEWPENDRLLWQEAHHKGDIIEPDGKAAHWRPATSRQVAKGYGLWLGYLAERGQLDVSTAPEQRITQEAVKSYIGELRQRDLATTTIASRIIDLYEAIRVMAPAAELSLLRAAKDRLRRQQTPRRNKQVRIAPSSELGQLAVAYLERLPSLPAASERMRASWFRDGLLVLLLAGRPIRLRNLATLEIGRHLTRRHDNRFHIALAAEETKDHLPMDFPCPEEVTSWMDHYLSQHRPLLLRGRSTQRLWISMRATPVSNQTLYTAVCKLTEQLRNRPINPHLFRDCLVSEMAERAPEQLTAASRILGHASLSITNKHYNQAQMLTAIKAHQKALEETFAELEEQR